MISTGRQTFAVLYPDDDYGLAYATEMERAFRRLREDVHQLVPYDATLQQFNAPVTEALADGAEAVAVVGTGAAGARVLAALAANDAPPDAVTTFVTSGLRVDDLGMLIDPRQPTASAGIRGVSPLARPVHADFEEAFAMASPGARSAYAAYAYDCVNLLALAAQAAGSDDAEEIQAEITSVSTGGSTLSTLRAVCGAAGRRSQHQPRRSVGRPRPAGRRRRRGGLLRRVRVRRAGSGPVDRDDHRAGSTSPEAGPTPQRVLGGLRRRRAGRPAA